MSCFCKLNVSWKPKNRRVHFVKLGTIASHSSFAPLKFPKSF